MERNDIISVALDCIKGKVAGNYSVSEVKESLRQALVDLNGGSTKINIKNFHRGNELFSVIEELIPAMIEAGLDQSNPIFNLVEYRNIAAGDVNEFATEGEAVFTVADTAAGIKGVRRQRIAGGETVKVKTTMKMVRVYENLGRLLAGRISFDKFVEGVADAFNKQIMADAVKAIEGIAANTVGLSAAYVQNGSFSEATLLSIIDHVEAATGKTARIYGTRTALRKVTTATVSDEAKSDLYNLGFYGKFNGTEMIALKQAHKPGTENFALNDSKLYIIAGDDQPIKMVNEGEGILISKDATDNNDLTQEYIYGQMYGTGVICANKLGVYTIA